MDIIEKHVILFWIGIGLLLLFSGYSLSFVFNYIIFWIGIGVIGLGMVIYGIGKEIKLKPMDYEKEKEILRKVDGMKWL